MRQGLFAIFLIFAAFAGGALVNGPGLEWGRQHLASLSKHLPKQLSANQQALASEAPDAEPDNSDLLQDSPSTTRDQPDSARSPLPVAVSSPFSSSSLRVEATPSRDVLPPEELVAESAPTVKAPLGPTIATESSPLHAAAPDPTATTPREFPEAPPSLLDFARRKLADRGMTGSEGQNGSPADATTSQKESTRLAATDEPSEPIQAAAPNDSAAAPATNPFEAVASSPGEKPPQPAAIDPSVRLASRSSGPEGQTDWAEVRAQMEDLGVGRFWVEGEFGGPVIFRCVVPMIGDRAVSQHFEAEGDDLISAARVTLRRIALWRATEVSP